MAYIISKMINGHGPYYYLVKSERDGDKVKQVHIKYLGKDPGKTSSSGSGRSKSSKKKSSKKKVPKTQAGKDKKVRTVMKEFKEGKLTSHGKKVTDRDQAVAIAMSESGQSRNQVKRSAKKKS